VDAEQEMVGRLVPRDGRSGRVLEAREEVVDAVSGRPARTLGEVPERGRRGGGNAARRDRELRGGRIEVRNGVVIEVDPSAQRRMRGGESDRIAGVRREARGQGAVRGEEERDGRS